MIGLNLTPEQEQVINKSMAEFRGNLGQLESALGALFVGANFGWRVLKIIHSSATYKEYEKVLGIKFQDVCPERGELANKSFGLRIADKLQSFWSVATGKKASKEKMLIGSADEVTAAINKLEAENVSPR